MSPTEMTQPVRYGTRRRRHEIVDDGSGNLRLLRTLGPDSPERRWTLPSDLLAAVRVLSDDQMDLLLPRGSGATLTYSLGHSTFIAWGLLTDPDKAVTAYLDTLTGVGRLLRSIHSLAPPPQTEPDLPAPIADLQRWLISGAGPGELTRLHELLGARLGQHRLATIRGWIEAAGTDTRRSIIHGAPLPALILAIDGTRRGGLVTGPELTVGTPWYDLGWLLGVLLELEHLPRARTVTMRPLAEALVRGYGAWYDSDAVGRIATLRVLGHLHGFAAYVAWPEAAVHYIDLVADLIDGDGQQALFWRN